MWGRCPPTSPGRGSARIVERTRNSTGAELLVCREAACVGCILLHAGCMFSALGKAAHEERSYQGFPGPFLSHPLIRGSACFWALL